MGLETTTYIDGLIPTNPLGVDPKSQGDDHIRLIKNALLNTFPNIDAAVTVTPAQINAIGTPGVICFSGMVVGFTGTQAQIPSGWQLCNGVGTTALGAVPDLRQKFLIGSTGDAGAQASGTTGGSSTHSHTVTVNDHTLTINQIPGHTHNVTATQYDGTNGAQSYVSTDAAIGLYNIATSSVGGGQAHNHTATSGSSSSLPPFYALAFIVKL